jgi:S1-C subfamily serine protease
MNVLDICIIGCVIGFFAIGGTKQPISQFYTSAGALTGLLTGAFIYSRLAYLAANSRGRTVMLALFIAATWLLCYDMFKSFGRMLESRSKKPHRKGLVKLSRQQRLASSLIAGLPGIVILWLILGMFDNVQIPMVQKQLHSSYLVAYTQQDARLPQLFRTVGNLLNPFHAPQPFVSTEPTFTGNVTASSSIHNPADTSSLYKVNSWGCGVTTRGSSFLVSRHTLITAAHVVAGANRISVQNDSGSYVAQVILFDPSVDVAVLSTDVTLPGTVLNFQNTSAKPGTTGVVFGYAGGNDLQQLRAVVLQKISAKGFDIYDKNTVIRSIYALRADITPGDSGAPLLDTSGRVLGLVFGHSTTQEHTGYAVTAAQISPLVGNAVARNQVVTNGSCTL